LCAEACVAFPEIDHDFGPNFRLDLSLPYSRNTQFAGRQYELDRLADIVNGDDNTRTIAALCGLGGVGKTEIVLEFVYRTLGRYTAVFWIQCATPEAVKNSFLDTAQRLLDHHANHSPGNDVDYARVAKTLGMRGLVDEDGQLSLDRGAHAIKKIIHAVIAWLSQDGNDKWLLVYDGVDNVDHLSFLESSDYFPKKPVGTIILTSRIQESKYIGTGSIEVEEMDEADGLTLFWKRVSMDSQDGDISGARAISFCLLDHGL
jgi:hypothetical protein